MDEHGHLVTSEEKLNDLYVETYKNRLSHNVIKDGLEEHQEMREELFNLRLDETKHNKSKPWTMNQLIKVLSSLKKGKSRDPLDLINEIFRPEVAGSDLKLALLKIVNKIKRDQKFPILLKYGDITSVYKGKGQKADMENQRGLFNLVTIRTIIDKLIYQEEYKNIENKCSSEVQTLSV